MSSMKSQITTAYMMVKKTSFFSVHKLLSFEKIINYGKRQF